MSKHIPSKTITTLKQDAKKLKKQEGLSQAEALEKIANHEGFKSWGLLLKAIKENKIESFEQLWELIMKPSVTVIAGRPSMGKSTLAIQFALKAAKDRDVFYFSYDMLASELSMRMLAIESGVENEKIEEKQFDDGDLRRIGKATKRLATFPLMVNDSSETVLSEMRSQISEKNQDKSFVVIDYLQLIPSEDDLKGRRKQVELVIAGIKSISKELGIPIVVLSQLSRIVDVRADKRPQKADLIGCDSLVSSADQLVFIYRDRYYDPDSMNLSAELIIPEHRNHQRSVLNVEYDSSIPKFQLN